MNRWSALAMLLVIAGGLSLRAPRLATRPLHNDEAVNAVKVTELWQHGRYAYDPDEYHGPTLHYATLPFLWLSGARSAEELGDATLRLAPVAFGVGLILLLFLLADGLGRQAAVWAAVFTAVSPAMVFYSRYFIHEMLLVFFTALTLGAAWRYVQTRSPTWAATAGAGLGLMFTTKETFVIAAGAMGLAWSATIWWTKRFDDGSQRSGETTRPSELQPSPAPVASINLSPALFEDWRHAALALSGALIVWLIFFSSVFTNFAGLLDSVRTYFPWLKRAGGHSPHIHGWIFYLERLAWFHPAKGPVSSEGLILVLSVIGAVVSLIGRRSALGRFLAFYTVILTVVYCAIPYKTPWCLLGFFHGMIMLAGIGAAWVVELFRTRTATGFTVAVLLALTAQLAWQAWRAGFVLSADRRNPYVYAQTLPDILNLVQRTDGIARVAPLGYETVIKIIAPESDYWPLPWYLRRFKHLGWYEELPADPFSPIIIVASALDARLDEKSDKKWLMAGYSELRPGTFFELYVELGLWTKYVATLPRERD